MRNAIPQIMLNDGLMIPAIGLGTAAMNGTTGANAITNALHLGYRLIDSAFNYENEGAVGEAIRRSSIAREDIIVTSKLPGRHHRYREAVLTIQESLFRSGVDYYDIYLIHWPNPKQELFIEAWQALVDAQKWGLIRSIGVSNFLPEHIAKLIHATGVTPSLNQVELHPFFAQEDQLMWNQAHGIQTESWSPLGRKAGLLFENEEIQSIAHKHHKSIAQIILRWHVQLGALPIPKASSIERQKANLEIFDFELSQEDMEAIKKLDRPDGRLVGQDPAEYEEF